MSALKKITTSVSRKKEKMIQFAVKTKLTDSCVLAQAYNPKTWGVKAKGSRIQSQLLQHGEFKASLG